MRLARGFAVAGLAALIACGGGGAAPEKKNTAGIIPAGVIKAAFAKAVAAKSARVAMTMQIDAAGESGTVTGSGVMSLVGTRGVLSLDFSDIPGSPFTGKLEMRFVDQVIYMKVPLLEQASGKPWIKIDFKALSKLSGVDLSQLTQLQSQDPTATLKYLEAVSGDVKETGTEEVRGVETTRYSATVDMQKAIDSMPEGVRSSMRKAIQKTGVTSAPIVVWIGGDGLLRRMAMTMDLPSAAGLGEGGTIKITMDLYDYGVPVSVSAPPAGQVGDFGELLGNQ